MTGSRRRESPQSVAAAISQATWDVLAKSWDEAQTIEFPAMVGQYVVIAFIQNSIRAARPRQSRSLVPLARGFKFR